MRCFGPRPCSGIDSTIIILNPPRRLGRAARRLPRGFLLIPPTGACRQCPLLKNFLARFGRRSRNRFAPDGLEYYSDDKLYHGCSVVMSYTRLIFSPMSLLRARDCAKPLYALRLHRCAARALFIFHKPHLAHFDDIESKDSMLLAFMG